jgi:two-component system sensor histidine kinase BaeS
LERVDLGAVAHDVVEQARALPLASTRTLKLDVEKQAICVRGDARRLHQVLLNLVTNALQHVPDAGCVSVTVYRYETDACIDVRDTGSGIPPDHLTHIFDRFYRAESARTRATGGAGLGLAIARAIVDAHGGSITAANAQNSGAVFRVVLPLR